MTMRSLLHDPSYNEAKKPLEEVFIQVEDGCSVKKIPALSKYFSCNRGMFKYEAPPPYREGKGFDLGAKEEWISQTESVLEDFMWLLRLEHHKFWSQLMYDKNSMDGLVSFLQEAYPFYLVDTLPDDYEIVHLYHKTCNMAYLIVRRIMTRVESDREWISEKTYAKLLYNNFVISIPMLIDICAIYGMNNRAEIRSILSSIFTIQPLYKDDLNKMVVGVKSVLSYITERFGCTGSDGSLIKLTEPKILSQQMTLASLEDILNYMLDISVSLSIFVDLCPVAGFAMHAQHLEVTIAGFYNSTLPDVANQIRRLCGTEAEVVQYFNLVLKLNRVRYHFIKLFHLCLITTLDNMISQSPSEDEEEVKLAIDNHLMVLNDCLAEKTFVTDYHSQYPIDLQLDRLTVLSPHIDSMKIKYILDSLTKTVGLNLNKKAAPAAVGVKSERKNSPARTPAVAKPVQPSVSSQTDPIDPVSISQEKMISELKEIFPYLSEGYLQKCLEHYNNSLQGTLNAILEETLPQELRDLDPDTPLIAKDDDERHPLPNRINVFDNDEFDVMTRDVIDKSRVHRGKKKSEYKTWSDMLDDKTHVNSLRQMYQQLSNTWVETDFDYDDEYDDSYDALPVPVEEVGDERRNFETPRVLLSGKKNNANDVDEGPDEEEIDDDSSSRPGNSGGFIPFAENPEEARARWEAKRQGNQRDYKGRPKGQGQDEAVLFNRHKKNVNKSFSGNHNRRKGAQHKRNQGMVPS